MTAAIIMQWKQLCISMETILKSRLHGNTNALWVFGGGGISKIFSILSWLNEIQFLSMDNIEFPFERKTLFKFKTNTSKGLNVLWVR